MRASRIPKQARIANYERFQELTEEEYQNLLEEDRKKNEEEITPDPESHELPADDTTASEEETGNRLAALFSRLHYVYGVPKWALNAILNNMIANALASTTNAYSIPLAALIIAKGWPSVQPTTVIPILIAGLASMFIGMLNGIMDMLDPKKNYLRQPREYYKAAQIVFSTLMYALRAEIAAYIFEKKLAGETDGEINASGSLWVLLKAFFGALFLGNLHAAVRRKCDRFEEQIKAMEERPLSDSELVQLTQIKRNARLFELARYGLDGLWFAVLSHTMIDIGQQLDSTYQPDAYDRAIRYGASVIGGLIFALLTPFCNAELVTRFISQLSAENTAILIGLTLMGMTPDGEQLDDPSKIILTSAMSFMLTATVIIGLFAEYLRNHEKLQEIKESLSDFWHQLIGHFNQMFDHLSEESLTFATGNDAIGNYGGHGHFERQVRQVTYSATPAMSINQSELDIKDSDERVSDPRNIRSL